VCACLCVCVCVFVRVCARVCVGLPLSPSLSRGARRLLGSGFVCGLFGFVTVGFPHADSNNEMYDVLCFDVCASASASACASACIFVRMCE